jgi:hypothetical protein
MVKCIFDENDYRYRNCDNICKKVDCIEHVDHISPMESGHYGYYNSKNEWRCYLNCNMCEPDRMV